MTLRDLIWVVAWFSVFRGLSKFYIFWLLKYTYKKSKSELEFFDFCNTTEIAKKKFKSNKNVFKKTILKGCLLVFFGLLFFILCFLGLNSEYSVLFTYKF